LFLSGSLETVGEVHHGTAVMDFLEAERERGITIQSACVSYLHKECKVNLIDTPGHADFNFEVERSLRVLDGALVIIDSLKGVEAQTSTVVKQANRYNVPKIFVFNKMDQEGADYEEALKDVQEKFGIKCLPLSIPVLSGDRFAGALDVVHQRILFWKELTSEEININGLPPSNFDHPSLVINVDSLKSVMFGGVELKQLSDDSVVMGYKLNKDEILENYQNALEEIVESLSEENPQIFDDYFNDKIHLHLAQFPEKISQLIEKYPNKFSLALPCSALKFRNIQQVMDAVVDYLPPPRSFLSEVEKMYERYMDQVSTQNRITKEKFTTQLSKSIIFFIFKRQLDPELGHLAFGRMYFGNIKYGLSLHAIHSELTLKINNMYRVRANELSQLKEIDTGDIVCLNVPEKVKSGDYLVAGEGYKVWKDVLPVSYMKSKPVFIASLDFETAKDRQ
jgi:elongation factor G